MANLTQDQAAESIGKVSNSVILPVASGARIFQGAFVSQIAGDAVTSTSTNAGPAIGIASHQADNRKGLCDAIRIETDCIVVADNATGNDAVTAALALGSTLYLIDDHTVADNDAGATRQSAGAFYGLEPNGRVRVFVSPRI